MPRQTDAAEEMKKKMTSGEKMLRMSENSKVRAATTHAIRRRENAMIGTATAERSAKQRKIG